MIARAIGLALFGNNSQGAQSEIGVDSLKPTLKGKRKNQWIECADIKEVTTHADRQH